MNIVRCLFFAFAAVGLSSSVGNAQVLPNICPPPARWVGGGGGFMCQCPDGSFLSLGQTCGSYAPPTSQPVGNYCSNGGTCPVGTKCSWMPGKCVPEGRVDCGSYNCTPGNKCSSAGCIAEEAVDCGNTKYCNAGSKCSRDGKRCLALNAIDCGSYSCSADLKCGSGNKCLARSDVDCGSGRSCPSGHLCLQGGAECLTRQELAEREARRIAEKKQQEDAARLAAQRKQEQDALRAKLWPVKGVPTGPLTTLNKDKVKYDWAVMQMASAAYSDKLVKGANVFKGNQDWAVAEKRYDTASGLFAYVFLNRTENRVVVAFRGSNDPRWVLTPNIAQSRDAVVDWSQDIKAYFGGKQPPQFKMAESILREVKKDYGPKYNIECVGHSLGGADCVYAAAQVQGVHGVAIDPISANSIATRNAYFIDNYVVPQDIANLGSKAFERGLTGWSYKVEPIRNAGSLPLQTADSTAPTADPLGSTAVARHSVERALDAIGSDAGLQRLQLAE
ncbi:MAG: hypothetical protein GHHEDOFH_00864 [Pseudorhodoplanes sp.]|nr:hypothetical protein [Pseudorhodoplanes sp.]